MRPADSSRRELFSALYADCYPRLLGYALRRTHTVEDAADVVAETFLVAWRRLEHVPPGDEARLWLYGVARRALANQRRGERRRERLEVRLLLECSLGTPTASVEERRDLEPVARAFARLRTRDREVLELVAWEGLAPRDLSVVLGCSLVAARVRLHRARRRFAQELSRAGVKVRASRAKRLDSLRGELL